MKKRNKNRKIYDYEYDESEDAYFSNANKYNKINFSTKNEYSHNKIPKPKKYSKLHQNNGKYYHKFANFEKYESFYPKNYNKTKRESDDIYIEYTDDFVSEKNNNFSKGETSQKNYKNFQYSSLQPPNDKNTKISEDNIYEDKTDKIKEKNKLKNSWIKSIPHPKKKKENENGFHKGKKSLNLLTKKEERNSNKKERKLSFTSSQNNESTKPSINTVNVSLSSNKEKDVSSEEKSEKNININLNNNFIKNKFDEDKDNIEIKEKLKQSNKYLENTDILHLKIKISENQIVTIKIKRYDDLFLTINLFCEIYSIDEQLMKPIILKALSALNTIYQIYNSNISGENLNILKNVQNVTSQK